MIGYVTLGVSDLERAKSFYGTVLAPLGAKPAFGSERMQGFANGAGPMLSVCTCGQSYPSVRQPTLTAYW